MGGFREIHVGLNLSSTSTQGCVTLARCFLSLSLRFLFCQVGIKICQLHRGCGSRWEGIHEASSSHPPRPLAAGIQLCPQPLSTQVHWPFPPALAPEDSPDFKAVRLLWKERPPNPQSTGRASAEETRSSTALQDLSRLSSSPPLLCIPPLQSSCTKAPGQAIPSACYTLCPPSPDPLGPPLLPLDCPHLAELKVTFVVIADVYLVLSRDQVLFAELHIY